MKINPVCPECGNPVHPDRSLVRDGVARCERCGEEVLLDRDLHRGAKAGATTGPAHPADEVATREQAIRKTLLLRLGRITEDLGRLGPVNDEVSSVTSILESLRGELITGHGPRGEPLDYTLFAGQISFAPRLLRRHGLDRLGDETAAARDALEQLAKLAPAGAAPGGEENAEGADQTLDGEPAMPYTTSTALRTTAAVEEPRRGSPAVLAGAAFAIVLAVIIAVLWLRRSGPLPAPANLGVTPTATSTAVPARATAIPDSSGHGDAFFDHIAAARQAVHDGDPETAAVHLDAAAGILRDRGVVFETATDIEQALLEAAEEAMVESQWRRADRLLATAVDVVSNFELSVDKVDDAIARLAAAQWVYEVPPTDLETLRSIYGEQVYLEMEEVDSLTGVLREADAEQLYLEVRGPVSGGKVVYDREVPVSRIDLVRYTAPSTLSECEAARARAADREARPDLVNSPL